ncbi:MAG: chorismate synthase [Thermoplasmata archaeon]
MKMTIFGSSHGEGIGTVIDGFPVGFRIDQEYIKRYMEYRKPGQSIFTTQRKENDVFEFLSGLSDGVTDGGPISIFIKNSDVISSYYDELKWKPRPGHSDFTLYLKYGDYRNYEGGGFLSGRMTAALVAGGAIALQYLEDHGIRVESYISSMGKIKCSQRKGSAYEYETRMPDPEADQEAREYILSLMKAGDSTGARINTTISGIPGGIGEPFFDSVESRISSAIFSIPAVKGIEFGAGFQFSEMRGSEANDEFFFEGADVRTRSNNNGGILGGITDGMPVTFSVSVKPTPSIHIQQNTVDLKNKENSTVIVKGRHDPCVAIRAVPVIECVSAFVILDLMMEAGSFNRYRSVQRH